MKRYVLILFIFFIPFLLIAQNSNILIPEPVTGTPFVVNDSNDLFGQSYRWFFVGEYNRGADSLKSLIKKSGFKLDRNAVYIVVANFSDNFTPIGIIQKDGDFFSNRIFGLNANNLFYIFISRQREGKSFLSLLATEKSSPFIENLPLFIGLFPSLSFSIQEVQKDSMSTYIDIRQFKVAKEFRKFSDLSVIVKSDLSASKVLAKTVIDNSSKEHFSYGIATALTSAKDVDLVVGNDGKITVKPKAGLDPALFGVINYHFKAIDSKHTSFGNSLHLLGGFRIIDFLEPIIGIGGGVDMGNFSLHLFAAYSFEFANELKSDYQVGDELTSDENPFKLKIRPKPRFGIEIKFP